ncbi:hypothetical protein LCGC14_2144920 [marine sediment metagenome]|uniref:Uncharacterized protein n=1 Tax=marine sediment metagenome TaxID=412755 RepID=A0A0F9GTM2_9ZZZZ
MAISNGYATLQEYKDYADITSTDATDDGALEDLIETASRFIDTQTLRTFYARTETRRFDVPNGRTLTLDDDLISITTLTNGDNEVLTTSDYILEPANVTPKFAIILKQSSTKRWELDSNSNSEQVIDVAGSWGWAATVPDQIKTATLEIAKSADGRRLGKNVGGIARVTAAGIVITPQDVSGVAKGIINSFRKRI